MEDLNYIRLDGDKNIVELQLSVLLIQEGEFFISYCPALNLSSYGDSVQEAKEGFNELMIDYIKESVKRKTLHQDLISHGWKLIDHKAEPPSEIELDIPSGILKQQYNQNWRVPALC